MKLMYILMLMPVAVNAELITTYHSRFGINAVTSDHLSVDIAITDQIKNPDFALWYRSFQAPALIDLDTRQGVTITSTVEQAEADLAALDNQRRPARKALRQLLGEKPTQRNIRQAERQAERGWTTAATYAIYIKAKTNELNLIRAIQEFEDEREALGLKKEAE